LSIEDRRRVVDRPITSGYRNDAMRIDTGDCFNLLGPIYWPRQRIWHCWSRTLIGARPDYS